MDLKQLRYFVQIADSGSVSRAAESLRVAQPSLSLRVKSLEDELGVQLLARHSRGVAPTEHGRIFLDHARRILREVDQIMAVLESTSANPTGRVSVGIPTSACRGLSYHLIMGAKEAYPGISVHIIEAMTGHLEEWIESGKLDVALLYDHRAFENVAWTEMMVEELMLVVPAGSELALRREVEFSELSGLPMVLPGRPNVLRNVIERLAARLELEIDVAIDCDSLPGIVRLVRQGHVTVMPEFAVLDEVASGVLVAIPLVNPVPSWRLSVVLSKRTSNTHCSQAIARLMAETIRGMVEAKLWRATLKF